MAMSPAEAREEQAAWRRSLKTFTGPLGNPLPYGNEQFEICAEGRQVAVFNCLEDARRVRDAINALLGKQCRHRWERAATTVGAGGRIAKTEDVCATCGAMRKIEDTCPA